MGFLFSLFCFFTLATFVHTMCNGLPVASYKMFFFFVLFTLRKRKSLTNAQVLLIWLATENIVTRAICNIFNACNSLVRDYLILYWRHYVLRMFERNNPIAIMDSMSICLLQQKCLAHVARMHKSAWWLDVSG